MAPLARFCGLFALLSLLAPARAQVSEAASPEHAPSADSADGEAVRPQMRRRGPSALDTAPVFYAAERGLRLHAGPGAEPFEAIPFREGVRVLGYDADSTWAYVRHNDRVGWVEASGLSNLWIRFDKSERTTYVYRGAELWRELPADVSPSDLDKERRAGLTEFDHQRIPEGTFYVTRLVPNSSYYRAFVISYPDAEDASRGLREGLISEGQYASILSALADYREPPMGTLLGGLIEIHGSGSGRRRAWTRGCIALRNVHMDELWDVVRVGTPVVIEP